MKKEYKTVNIEDIKPYENNPRLNDSAVDAVKKSISQCGYIAPIVVDEDMVVLAGHTRLQALLSLKRDTVDVLVVSGLTDDQKRKYRLLDNKTDELADWNFDALAEELEGLDFGDLELGWGIDDFTDQELEKFMSDEAQERPQKNGFEVVVDFKTEADAIDCLDYLKDGGYEGKIE